MTQLSEAKRGKITLQMKDVALCEKITLDMVRKGVAAGQIVIPYNPIHAPSSLGIGKGLRVKVNANIGTSREYCRLKEEVEKAHRPVIALIGSSDPIRRWVHAVVITGLDMDKYLIYYNDPVFGEVEEDIGIFMSKWEGADRFLIKVKIGMREQKLLDEYFQKKEKGE